MLKHGKNVCQLHCCKEIYFGQLALPQSMTGSVRMQDVDAHQELKAVCTAHRSALSPAAKRCNRRAPRRPWGRADLPRHADCPVDVLTSWKSKEAVDAHLGLLVQPPPAAGAHRQHPARGSRGQLPPSTRRVGRPGLTHASEPPRFPARFT